MTGPALSGHSHPSSTVLDYLEGGNLSTFDRVYENQRLSATFNDQPYALAP
jgi:hypothetical protein